MQRLDSYSIESILSLYMSFYRILLIVSVIYWMIYKHPEEDLCNRLNMKALRLPTVSINASSRLKFNLCKIKQK